MRDIEQAHTRSMDEAFRAIEARLTISSGQFPHRTKDMAI